MRREFKEWLGVCLFLLAVVNGKDTSKGNVTATSNETKSEVNDQDDVFLAHEEQRLVAYLFRNYDNNVRPVSDPKKNLSVVIVPSVRQIVEINERQQVLTLYFWLRVYWYDRNFMWNKDDFSNITQINVDPDSVWLPDISLVNSAQEGQDALIYRKMRTKVQLHNDGLCRWLSPYFSSTSCNIDSTNFPFDQQVCKVEMASWTATGLVIDVNLGSNDTLDTSSYLEHIQWKLESYSARKEINYYSYTPAPYPSVVFEFVLRRRSLFYIINLIFPCVILSFLSLMTFYIPPASGERITLSISLLLTMLFTLYIVTENLPPDSTTVPLLTKFIGVAMLIMTLSLFGTSVSIKFDSKAEVMPKWMSIIVNKYLAYLVLRDTSWLGGCSNRRRKNRGERVLHQSSPEDNHDNLLHEYRDDDPGERRRSQSNQEDQPATCRHRMLEPSQPRLNQESQPSNSENSGNPIMADIASKFHCLSSQVEKEIAEEELEDNWKEAGLILNRLFLWAFLAVLLFSTIAIFSNAKYTE